MRKDYNKETFTKVRVCGIECDFSDIHSEVTDDDESQGIQSEPKEESWSISSEYRSVMYSYLLE